MRNEIRPPSVPAIAGLGVFVRIGIRGDSPAGVFDGGRNEILKILILTKACDRSLTGA